MRSLALLHQVLGQLAEHVLVRLQQHLCVCRGVCCVLVSAVVVGCSVCIAGIRVIGCVSCRVRPLLVTYVLEARERQRALRRQVRVGVVVAAKVLRRRRGGVRLMWCIWGE